MANFFDQFDPVPQAAAAPVRNFFDQFDEPAQPAAIPLQQPAIVQADRPGQSVMDPAAYDPTLGAVYAPGQTPVMRNASPTMQGASGPLPVVREDELRATARSAADAALLGTGDKLAAGVKTGFGFAGDYDQQLAAERSRSQELHDAYPLYSGAGHLAGMTGAMVTMNAAGLPVFGGAAMRMGANGIAEAVPVLQRAWTAGKWMAPISAAAGAVAADGDVVDRVKPALYRGGIEGGLAAGGPVAGAGLYALGRAAKGAFDGFAAPAEWANRQIVNTLGRSGRTVDQVAADMGQAALEGQPMFATVDALGNAGQRTMTTVTKAPGIGREEAVEFLNARQAGQGRRIVNQLTDAFEAPQTAEATAAGLKAARNATADQGYAAARAQAGAVDTSGAIARIDDTLRPGVTGLANPGSGIANDSVESVLSRARSLLTDGRSQATGFEAVQRVKGDLDDMVRAAVRAGHNNRARLLGQVADELDAAMVTASEPYAAARDAYRQGSREMEAVATGRQAATRGRTEDTIPAFDALTPGEQAAYRAGYVDPYVSNVQGAAEGVNKARQFTSDAVRAEFPAFAAEGRGDMLMRQIGRENTMFGTRQAALGGSATVENAADMAASNGVDIGQVVAAIHSPVSLARALMEGVAQKVTGSTEPSRHALARALMETDPARLRATVEGTNRSAREAAERAAMLGRILMGGGAWAAGVKR